jgi:tol-pal system protein YbgF
MNRIANATVAIILAGVGLALVVTPPAAAQGGYALEQRFQDMERLITQLTGQVERLQNQVQQLQQQLERQQSDYEYRLEQLEGGRGGRRAPPAPKPAPAPRGDATPPALPGSLSPSQQADVRPLGSTPSSGAPPTIAAAPPAAGSTPEQTYNSALAAMRGGDYADAERGFRDFLARHPRHQLAANAQYWLGETYYVRKDYQSAATAFATGFRNYRNSSVGPDNLLKLGMALHASGKSADACTVYGQFNQVYPKASDALKRRIAAERQRSRCG